MHHALILLVLVIHHDHGLVRRGLVQDVLLELALNLQHALSTMKLPLQANESIPVKIRLLIMSDMLRREYGLPLMKMIGSSRRFTHVCQSLTSSSLTMFRFPYVLLMYSTVFRIPFTIGMASPNTRFTNPLTRKLGAPSNCGTYALLGSSSPTR